MSKDFEIKTTFRAVDKMSKVVGGMQAKLMKFTAGASMSLRKLDRGFSKVSGYLTGGIKKGFFAAAAGATALGGAIWGVMRQFSKVEDAEAAFTPLMGGAERARELVDALNKTAATTPYQFENLSAVTQTLLPVMNGDIEKTIKTLRMMGDTAGGSAQKFEGIAYGFTKAMLKGKVDMESLNMIGEKGVPIIDQLGKMYGKTTAQVLEMVKDGKVGLNDLNKVFERMTSEGGIYFNGMEIASKTLTGRMSTWRDVISLTIADLGDSLAPIMKDLVDIGIKYTEQVKAWVSQNKELIRTKVTEFIKKIPGYFEKIVYWAPKISAIVGTFYAISIAVKVASVSMRVFNALTKINPGPMRKFTSMMGTDVPTAIGKGTGAAGKLTGALSVLAAGAFGWEIGTLIHDNIVDPLMKAHHEVTSMVEDLAVGQGMLGKMSKPYLEAELGKINKTEKEYKSNTLNKILDAVDIGGNRERLANVGFGFARMNTMLEIAKRDAQSAATLHGQKSQSVFTGAMSVPMATTSVERSEARLVIEDRTGAGRLERKSGKTAKGITLVHTGVAP